MFDKLLTYCPGCACLNVWDHLNTVYLRNTFQIEVWLDAFGQNPKTKNSEEWSEYSRIVHRVRGWGSLLLLRETVIKHDGFRVGQTESIGPHDFFKKKVQSAIFGHHDVTAAVAPHLCYNRLLDMHLISWLDSGSTAGFCGLCHSSAPGPAANARRTSTSPLTWNTVKFINVHSC